MRVEHSNDPEVLGELTSTIGQGGGVIGALDMVQVRDGKGIRDLTANARASHGYVQLRWPTATISTPGPTRVAWRCLAVLRTG